MIIFVFACKLYILFASAVASSAGCGGTITLTHPSTGIITSPNYPSDYPNNLHCVWQITGVGYTRIDLIFEDFYVEERDDNDLYDYVQIDDRNLYEGYSAPSIVPVEGTDFTLRLVTDSGFRYRGFKLVYKTFKDCDPLCVNGMCDDQYAAEPFCQCDNGWIGIDCSLSTCPNTETESGLSFCQENIKALVCRALKILQKDKEGSISIPCFKYS